MADAGEQITFEDAGQAISLGRRNLLVRDYDAAVSAFGDGCAMLSSKHGEMADELGEPYLLYGKALLGLSREEQTVLGSAVPGSDETAEDVEGEGEAGAEADAEAESEAAESEAGAEGEAETETEEKEKGKEENTEESKSNETVSAEGETKASPSVSVSEAGVSSENTPSEAAGPSESTALTNGKASTSKIQQNGDAHDDGEADDDDDDNDDEDTNNLQLAWEVLELAKLILLKRGPPGWKLLAETHRMLGEVAMESGNQPGALTDLNACLDLLRKIEPADPRSMAETYYQLGLAYALGNEFDNSIEQFKEAISLLETRIKELEDTTDTPQTDDPFYTVAGEIKELKELLPEIQEKIADMRDFKQQAAKLVIEGIKNHVSGGSCSNGAGPSGEGSSSSSSAAGSSKPASDISHLVRKKRKNEEEESSASPCKKPTPEKVP